MDEQNTAEQESRETIARLASEVLPRLIERLTRSELGELEVRESGWRIRLRRPVAAPAVDAAPRATAESRRQPVGPGAAPGAPGHGGQAGRPTPAHRSDGGRGTVASPGVGYFVGRDSVKPGADVRRGDLVGYVDVLGVRQEVVAPIDGVVSSFQVEPGQAVEFGQPLAQVDAKVESGVQ